MKAALQNLRAHKGKFSELGSLVKKDVHLYLRCHIVGDLDVSVGTGALSVNDSLRDSLTGEVSKLVEEVEVLGEDGSAGAGGHRVLVVVDGGARARRDNWFLHIRLLDILFFKFVY